MVLIDNQTPEICEDRIEADSMGYGEKKSLDKKE